MRANPLYSIRLPRGGGEGGGAVLREYIHSPSHPSTPKKHKIKSVYYVVPFSLSLTYDGVLPANTVCIMK